MAEPVSDRPTSWVERHASRIGIALFVVPLLLAGALRNAGLSNDQAELVQVVVGSIALIAFVGVFLTVRRRRAAAASEGD